MHWLILAAVSVLSLSAASLFQKVAMKEESSDPVSSSIIFQLLLIVFYGLYAVYKGFSLPDRSLIGLFLLSSALYAYGTIKFFQAIKILEASRQSIITSSGVIITTLASVLFLGNVITLRQSMGILLVLISVFLLQYRPGHTPVGKGELLAFLGTMAYGMAVVIDTRIIGGFNAVSFVPVSSFLSAVMLVLYYPKKIPAVITGLRKINRNLLVFCFLYALQAVAFYQALEQGALVAQLSSIARTSIVLTVVLSTIFLRERDYIGRKIAASLLTMAGIFLIA